MVEAAGIEPETRNTLSVLDIVYKLISPIF